MKIKIQILLKSQNVGACQTKCTRPIILIVQKAEARAAQVQGQPG